MAQGARPYRFRVTLSDVDRGEYRQIDVRMARHPSETARFLLLRLVAYCLSYEPGIAFAPGGLSAPDEPTITIRDESGVLRSAILIQSPSVERLHRASKAAERVALFTTADASALELLKRQARERPVHRLEELEVFRLDPGLFDELEAALERTTELELVRTGNALYVTIRGGAGAKSLDRRVVEGRIDRVRFGEP